MKYLGFGFLLFLCSIPPKVALAGPPSFYSFTIENDSVRFSLSPSQESLENFDTVVSLYQIKSEVLPAAVSFFKGTNVLPPKIEIILVDQLENNYCAFVEENETKSILISRKCTSGGRLKLLVAHELWHLLTNRLAPNSPTWLTEGLAELFMTQTTGMQPILAWRQILNASQTPSLSFTSANVHEIHHFARSQQYAFAQLFLTYVFEHFGKEQWLRAMVRLQAQGIEGIKQAAQVGKPNIDEKHLRFNSMFLNFVIALNINSTMYAENLQFAIATSDQYTTLKQMRLFPRFEILNTQGFLDLQLANYQTISLQLETDSQCLQWQSSGGRTQVYKLRRDAKSHGLQKLEPKSCFTLNNGEILSVIQFEGEAQIRISRL
jgi:hypothetical protein